MPGDPDPVVRERGADSRGSGPVELFASGVIHQLRNQLTVIRNCSYTLQQLSRDIPEREQESVKPALDLALTAIGRVYDLAVAFADFAWIPPDGIKDLDLNGTLRRLRDLVEYRFVRADWLKSAETTWRRWRLHGNAFCSTPALTCAASVAGCPPAGCLKRRLPWRARRSSAPIWSD